MVEAESVQLPLLVLMVQRFPVQATGLPVILKVGIVVKKLQQVSHAMIPELQTIGVIVIVKESIKLPRFKFSIEPGFKLI